MVFAKLTLFKPYDIYKFENILDTIKRELALCGIDSKLQQQKKIKKNARKHPRKICHLILHKFLGNVLNGTRCRLT